MFLLQPYNGVCLSFGVHNENDGFSSAANIDFYFDSQFNFSCKHYYKQHYYSTRLFRWPSFCNRIRVSFFSSLLLTSFVEKMKNGMLLHLVFEVPKTSLIKCLRGILSNCRQNHVGS